MEGLAVLFLVARSVAPVEEPEHEVTVLVETSNDGWGETNMVQLLDGEPVDPGDNDTLGPISVAIAVESRSNIAGEDEEEGANESARKARLVVIGDSDFMSDTEIANAGNLVLAVNAFNWLADQEHALGIAARAVDQTSMYLTSGQMQAILLIVLVILPGAAIVGGILIWRRRRR